MKNITVTVDDEVYRRARIRAAEMDTSVSSLVSGFLKQICVGESEFDRLAREEGELRAQIKNFSAADNVSRDELYRRS
jgi:plasmid stability protein